MKNNENIFIYAALVIVVILMIVGFIPMKSHAQTIDMSFGQVTNMNIYRMKIQVSEDITWKWLTVTPYGGWTTWSQWSHKSINGYPFRDTYDIGVKTIFFENWFIDFNHYCTHDVMADAAYNSYTNSYTSSSQKYFIKPNTWDKNLTVVTMGYHKKFSSLSY